MKGKLIVIEGTDCSGKETQSKMLINRLTSEGIKCEYFSFPNYNSPTGKIVGYPYLGKKYLCEELVQSKKDNILKDLNDIDSNIVERVLESVTDNICDGWFIEGAPNVDGKISSLYYAADRSYNLNIIVNKLNEGTNIILDRYTYSNMAHQGGKEYNKEEREKLYNWIDKLEFEMLGLIKPDLKIFLHMPYEYAVLLKQGREEKPDQNELDPNHLINAENAFIEIAERYGFNTIECVYESDEINKENIKSIESINEEVYNIVKKEIK